MHCRHFWKSNVQKCATVIKNKHAKQSNRDDECVLHCWCVFAWLTLPLSKTFCKVWQIIFDTKRYYHTNILELYTRYDNTYVLHTRMIRCYILYVYSIPTWFLFNSKAFSKCEIAFLTYFMANIEFNCLAIIPE